MIPDDDFLRSLQLVPGSVPSMSVEQMSPAPLSGGMNGEFHESPDSDDTLYTADVELVGGCRVRDRICRRDFFSVSNTSISR